MARILIVDDDPDIQKLGRKILAAAQHDVFLASSAMEAMDSLSQQNFELVITDANMPLHSGLDLLRTLRHQARFAALPIMMLSGRRDRETIEKALKLGSADYLLKPLDPILFLNKVEAILSRHAVKGAQSAEIQLANVLTKNRIQAESILSVPVTLKSLSEMGLVVTSSFPLQEDMTIELDIPLFKEINVAIPHLKVLSCLKTNDGYETRVHFIGVDDSNLQKIRSWIIQNTPRKAS
jgi:DNA-binding NtrC family response regulator